MALVFDWASVEPENGLTQQGRNLWMVVIRDLECGMEGKMAGRGCGSCESSCSGLSRSHIKVRF